MESSTVFEKSREIGIRVALLGFMNALAAFRRESQPELFAHVNPHGHATARLARRFTAVCVRSRRGGGTLLDEIELGAQLHDIGKYLIDKSIMLKPGPLDAAEREIVSHHPVYGVQILAGLPYVTETVRQIVLYHHERWDGTGYPEGLSGTSIPLAARLVSVADVYASLRARRSYKPTYNRVEASRILLRMAGHELDPELVRDFLGLLLRYEEVRCA